jgi:ABC-type Zn uptake system ZnuABC Zn-binding protein ZnuA
MKKLKKLSFALSILSILTFFTPANAELKVVTSIKPIHSLASYLMDGIGKPELIVDGYASPHGFSMKPSHAKMLQNADLIFWVGEDLENFLEKPLKSIAKKAEKIELIEIKGLNVLKFRERNIFDEHDHDMMITVRKKMITTITTMMITVRKKMITTITTMMITVRKKMITTITTMMITVRKKSMMIMTTMMDTKVMRTVNLIHTFGWIQ